MRVAAYARYSSDNQREESIDAQIRAIQDYCAKNGHTIVKTYIDEAMTATSDDRPQFLQMIQDATSGDFELVIVHKLDRFARNRFDSAFYRRKLRDAGNIRLTSVLENLDDSPESIILESVLEGMAEYFSANLSREVKKGFKETALQGKHVGGIPLYGYDVGPDQKYVINSTEAFVVRKTFGMYLAGENFTTISKELNNFGHKTKRGNSFTPGAIRDMLSNEKYIGTFVFNRHSKHSRMIKKPDEEIVRLPGAMPAIIPEDDFKLANSKIILGKRGPRMSSERIYLLTGKLECGQCGAPYFGNSYRGKNKEYVYSCADRESGKGCTNTSIGQTLIENQVIEILKTRVFNERQLNITAKRIIEHIKNYKKEYKEEKKLLAGNLSKAKKKKDRLLDLYTDGQLNIADYREKVNPIDTEINNIKEKISALNSQNYPWINPTKVKEFLRNSNKDINSNDKKRILKVIKTFVSVVKIYPDKTTINITVDNTLQGVAGAPLGATNCIISEQRTCLHL